MRIVHAVYRVPDEDWSGPSQHYLIGLFENPDDAARAAWKQGSWGASDGPIEETAIFSSTKEYQDYIVSLRQKAQENGIESLTPFEQRVVGRVEPR